MANRPASWKTWPVEVRELFDRIVRGGETGDAELPAFQRLLALAIQDEDRALSDAALEAIDAATEVPDELCPRTPDERAAAQEEYRRSGDAAFRVAMAAELAQTAPTQELRDHFTALLERFAAHAPRGKA